MPRATLADHLRLYADHHRHPLNQLTHKLAVPLIVFHIVAMLSWFSFGTYFVGTRFEMTPTLGHVAYVAAIGWYVTLDVRLAVLVALLIGLCFPVAAVTPRAVVIGIAIFAWLLQLTGHVVWEKRALATRTSWFQALISPMFYVASIVQTEARSVR